MGMPEIACREGLAIEDSVEVPSVPLSLSC